MEDEFSDEVYGKKMKATLISAAQSIQNEVKEIRGRDLTPVNIFQFLIEPATPRLLDYTQQSMHISGLMQTNVGELQQVIATMFLRSTHNVSTDAFWDRTKPLFISEGLFLMNKLRFLKVVNNIRGFEISGRETMEGSTEWLQQSNLLCRTRGMEELMFECSANICSTDRDRWSWMTNFFPREHKM